MNHAGDTEGGVARFVESRNMSTPTSTPIKNVQHEISAWLPEDAQLKVFTCLDRTTGAWYAIAADFNIAAMGTSLAAAIEELVEQIEVFFAICIDEGKTFEQSRQPIPRRRRLEYDLKVWLSKRARRRDHDGARANEWVLPARGSLNAAHAH